MKRGLRPGLVPVFAALAFGALSASASAPAPHTYCGEGYWFRAEPPPGWQRTDWTPSSEGLALAFGPTGDSAEVQIGLVMSNMYSHADARADEALDGAVQLLLFHAAPTRIEDSPLRHPRLPSRAALVTTEEASALLVAIAPPRGRGRSIVVSLTGRGRTPQAAHLAALRALLGNLRVDPDRACRPGSDGGAIEIESALPAALGPDREPSAPDPEPPRALDALGEPWCSFPYERAAMGCSLLSRLFVPVGCAPATVDGAPAVFVDFFGSLTQYGGEPKPSSIERFASRIAAPWCWQARGRAGAPKLVFAVDDEGLVQEFDCGEERLGAVRRGRVERLEPPRAR